MSSAQESATGMGFINTKSVVEKRLTLEFLGHKQGTISIQFDNKAAVGILTDQITQRRSKTMDMRFFLSTQRTSHRWVDKEVINIHDWKLYSDIFSQDWKYFTHVALYEYISVYLSVPLGKIKFLWKYA